ncbi:hypothetical protein CTheo_7496 [Ceratobasidium theobromae]|uniref:Uncharacterized protein n=1 Tax=Ceratobasidium theobromae TaxID=1582974 RepID=A0A5N5QBE3_9AGAM|nr:hypothetical protein CTheo_7496 [Ceratobasidium theobromae]
MRRFGIRASKQNLVVDVTGADVCAQHVTRLTTVTVRVPDLSNALHPSDPMPLPQIDPNSYVIPRGRKRYELHRVIATQQ